MSPRDATGREGETPKGRILVVDDEPAITLALARKLRREGYECLTAASGEEALGRLEEKTDLDVILTDIRMPGMDGLELLKEIKRRAADVQVIVMTAYAEISFTVDALRRDADDYLLKPFDMADLSHSVSRALEHRRLLRENRAFRGALHPPGRGTADRMTRLCVDGVAALANAIQARDQYGDGHLDRVARYALATGGQLGMNGDELWSLWLGALLHDVGMLNVPETAINKPGALSDDEWSLVHGHPAAGVRIIEPVGYLDPAVDGVLHHHERWDGSGYPGELAGTSISVQGRILAVVDAYDAMTHDRPYRERLQESAVIEEIQAGAGSQFDPRIVEAFAQARDEAFPIDSAEYLPNPATEE